MTTPNANAAPSPTRLVVTASWCERGDGSPEQTAAVLRRLVAAFPNARLTMTSFIASRLTQTPVFSEPYEGPVSVEIETEVASRAPTERERAILIAQRRARDATADEAQQLTALRLHAHWYERGDADSPELTAVVLSHLLSAFPSTRITSEYDGQGRFHLAGRADMPTSEGTA